MNRGDSQLHRRRPSPSSPPPSSPIHPPPAAVSLYPSETTLRTHFPSSANTLIKVRDAFYIILFLLSLYPLVLLLKSTPRFERWIFLRSGYFRAPLEASDVRQVGVFAMQGSGTTEMVSKLQNLGIEIAHEALNTHRTYCRDGTLGWLLGIQGISAPDSADLELLCGSKHPRKGVYHSVLFENSDCSEDIEWGECWQQACRTVTSKNYGCLNRKEGCETPFRKRLLQVRHPLTNIASNVVKWCKGKSKPSLDVLHMLQSFFPEIQWENMQNCVQIMTR